MYQFFTEDIFGLTADTANWISTGIIALLVLIVLYFLYRLISRPRLASGRRSKQARLAITDAAAVDERRRLVLVRRDDVEHLVMIGGAADIVIESNIRKNAPARPLATQPTTQPAPQAIAPTAPVPTNASVRPPVSTPQPAVVAPAAPKPTPPAVAPAAPKVPSVAPVVAAVGGTAAAVSAVASDALESTKTAVKNPSDLVAAPPKTSVGDDMDALLNEITSDK